jgi:hypothetical protein
MLDIKTVRPKPFKRLMQLCDGNGNPTVLRVVKYDSEKCKVICATPEHVGCVEFILQGPSGEFFLQEDIYALGSVFESSRTAYAHPLTKEDALARYIFNLETREGDIRVSLEDAFGITPEEI